MAATIQIIDIHDSNVLCEVGALVRRAFFTVAAEFHLTRLNCPTHPAFQSDGMLLQSLSRPNTICFGAFQKDNMIGFAALAPKSRNTMELTRLCVDPDYRHHEIGAFLLDSAMVYAQSRISKKHGTQRIVLSIIDENKQLKNWYLSYGFTALAIRHINGLPFTICDMAKRLYKNTSCMLPYRQEEKTKEH